MIPLYSAEQVRKADNYAINKLHIPGIVLMENAAINILNAVLQKYPYIDKSYRFGIICGKGNNGGDGFALARHLLINGFDVNVLSFGSESQLKGDALSNYKILKNIIADYESSSLNLYKTNRDLNSILGCEIIVDAILGTGSKGELKEPYSKIIPKLNASQSLRIAIDVPTGLILENASGSIIFNAHLTVTLADYKSGLFYEKGREYSGKVVRGSIGIGNKYFRNIETDVFLIEPEDALDFLPIKNSTLHKYSAGKVLTVAGSKNYPGAGIFAMNAAMMSGTGAGLLASPNSIRVLVQSSMSSAVVIGYEDNESGVLATENIDEIESKIKWADSIALGPGLGRNEKTQEAVFEIMKRFPNKNFVIDADGIVPLSNNKYKKLDLTNFVFTPHHHEFTELIGVQIGELKQNLMKYAREFCTKTNAYLVLKGAPTIICNPDGEIFINSSGNPGMAKFGTGDILTGMIASFLAQQDNIEGAIISAVYIHSLAADLIQKRETEFGIIPEKLISEIPNTIKFLRKSVV